MDGEGGPGIDYSTKYTDKHTRKSKKPDYPPHPSNNLKWMFSFHFKDSWVNFETCKYFVN